VGAGALLLAGAFFASQFLSRRLSEPVEKLAVDSEENREHWHRAEAALESTSQELQRSARFSADASHQLKTPVTVLRAGLEGLLAGDQLAPEAREEVSALVHQTFRLASVIEDLLLLSRMDAGRLQIQFSRLDLSPLLEALLDDLGALPDIFDLEIDADIPPTLWIAGREALRLPDPAEPPRERAQVQPDRRPGPRLGGGGRASGRSSPSATRARDPGVAQEHIFERFHRGAVGENVPGHGIGLNLARELARLHGGDLRLSALRRQLDRVRAALPPGKGGRVRTGAAAPGALSPPRGGVRLAVARPAAGQDDAYDRVDEASCPSAGGTTPCACA
jgi:signal transduction histidine kinase